MNITETINTLLREEAFINAFAANADDVAYSDITVTAYDEIIATNLAALYAVEAGITIIVHESGLSPAEIITAVVQDTLSHAQWQLMRYFANATWKACQPIKSIEKIQKSNFILASKLPVAEIVKDDQQVIACCNLLLQHLRPVVTSDTNAQWQAIRALLQSSAFAEAMAENQFRSYYVGIGENAPDFYTAKDKTDVNKISSFEQHLAMQSAKLYPLISCIDYLQAEKKLPAKDVLLAIKIDDAFAKNNKYLFSVFAHATWKTCQPFFGLQKIRNADFIAFALLDEPTQNKYWNHIKEAANFLWHKLETRGFDL